MSDIISVEKAPACDCTRYLFGSGAREYILCRQHGGYRNLEAPCGCRIIDYGFRLSEPVSVYCRRGHSAKKLSGALKSFTAFVRWCATPDRGNVTVVSLRTPFRTPDPRPATMIEPPREYPKALTHAEQPSKRECTDCGAPYTSDGSVARFSLWDGLCAYCAQRERETAIELVRPRPAVVVASTDDDSDCAWATPSAEWP